MSLLDLLIIILVISWLGGFSLHVAGNFIHLVLVIVFILLIARLLGL